MHARGRGRRRCYHLEAAIAAPDRLAIDAAIAGKIIHREIAARARHVLGDHAAERAAVEQVRPVLGNCSQRIRVGAHRYARAGGDRRAAGQEQSGDLAVAHEIGRALGRAFAEVGGGEESAVGVADGGLQRVRERTGAEAGERFAPGLERAGHGNSRGADCVAAADRVHRPRRCLRVGGVGVRPRGGRGGREPVHDEVASVGQSQMRDAAAQDADHHRLDDGQREQRRDRRVDRVPAARQHLGTCRRCERMVRHHHAARAGGRTFLANKSRGTKLAPALGHRFLLIPWRSAIRPRPP